MKKWNFSPSYSFGLENVYKLEKVDPSTIRAFKPTKEEKKEVSARPLLPHHDLLGGFPILSLWDRIDRLSLSPPLLYHLRKEGWETLEELLQAEESSHPKIRALPKPLQDILEKALAPFKEIRKAQKVSLLDLKGLLRGLGRGIDFLSYLAFIDSVGLLSFYGASPYEKVQVDRLESREKEEKIRSALSLIREKSLESLFREILEGLLFGWIEKRGGITKKNEIVERIEQNSLEKGGGEGFIRLILSLFTPWLHLGEEIIAFQEQTASELHLIRKGLSSLFYRPHLTYHFSQLASSLEREFLPLGEPLDLLLLRRYLLLSPSYRMKRDSGLVTNLI